MPAKDNRNFLSFNRIIITIIIITVIIAIIYIIIYLFNISFLSTINRNLWIIISDPTGSFFKPRSVHNRRNRSIEVKLFKNCVD